MTTTSFAVESITVSTTSIGLTASVYEPAAGAAKMALVTIEDAAIRWRADGSAATATSPLAYQGDVIVLDTLAEIRNFRAIRNAGTDATLRISYGR